MSVSKSYPETYVIVDFPAGNPPAGTVWLWRSPKGWAEKRSDGTVLYLTPDQAFESESTSTAPLSHTAVASAIDKTVIEWQNQGYKSDRIVVRQNAFFKCVIAHAEAIDPITDKGGHWSKFPQEGNVISANRSPTVADKYPEGRIWEDLSFGVTTPLRFITTGDGEWFPLNQITLSRVRFDLYGNGSTYQSRLSNIKFYKADGTEIPNGWWVWGARAGLGGQQAGTNYTGQNISAQYNASGWAELEPSAAYDLSQSISKVTGSTAYVNIRSVTFYYSNGGSKNFTPSGGNLATIDPPINSRFGDSTISSQGEVLTAAKLTNPDSEDPGRVTGHEFVSAVRTIIQSSGAKREIIRSDQDPDYDQEWETWRKVTEDLTAWTITVVEYARTSQDSSMPMIVRTEPRRPPTHDDATTNAQGEFVAKIPGGGEFVYTNSRNGGNNYATFPPDVYKEVASYYVDANDVPIPLTTMAQQVAAGSTALGIGAIAISTEAIAFVVDFYRMDNSLISYKIPLT